MYFLRSFFSLSLYVLKSIDRLLAILLSYLGRLLQLAAEKLPVRLGVILILAVLRYGYIYQNSNENSQITRDRQYQEAIALDGYEQPSHKPSTPRGPKTTPTTLVGRIGQNASTAVKNVVFGREDRSSTRLDWIVYCDSLPYQSSKFGGYVTADKGIGIDYEIYRLGRWGVNIGIGKAKEEVEAIGFIGYNIEAFTKGFTKNTSVFGGYSSRNKYQAGLEVKF